MPAPNTRGQVLETTRGYRVVWEDIVCMPRFSEFGHASAYLTALRRGQRLRLEFVAGGWAIVTGELPPDAAQSPNDDIRSYVSVFDGSSRVGMPLHHYRNIRRSEPLKSVRPDSHGNGRPVVQNALVDEFGSLRTEASHRARFNALRRRQKADKAQYEAPVLKRRPMLPANQAILEGRKPMTPEERDELIFGIPSKPVEKPGIPELPAMFRKVNGTD